MKVLVLLKVKEMVQGQVHFFVAKLHYNQNQSISAYNMVAVFFLILLEQC